VVRLDPFAPSRVFVVAFVVAAALISTLVALNSASTVTLLPAGTVVGVAPMRCVIKYFDLVHAATLTGTLSSNLPLTLYVAFANHTFATQPPAFAVYTLGPRDSLTLHVRLQNAKYALYLCNPNSNVSVNVGVVDPVALR
jgi:hypothetical protein